jgi:hypothetical protein
MNRNKALSLIDEDIRHSIENTEEYLQNQDALRKICGKPNCEYCERMGKVKLTFARTKPLLQTMYESLVVDSSPRLIIARHRRNAYGNYQAWVLANGHYVNCWKIGGHSVYSRMCGLDEEFAMIKLHAQYRTNVHIYGHNNPPTSEQMATLRDVYADAISHGYERKYQLCLILNYDVNHPDPRWENENRKMPF